MGAVRIPSSNSMDAPHSIIVSNYDALHYHANTLIFVVEDDAQDGPDHVDAHRSIAFVVGPYVRQGAVIPSGYTTVSMIATIIDFLGILEPSMRWLVR